MENKVFLLALYQIVARFCCVCLFVCFNKEPAEIHGIACMT